MRRYYGVVSELGGRIRPRLTFAHAPEREEPVTAIDERDVTPLVEAARKALLALEQGRFGDAFADLETEPVRAALQTYEKGGSDGRTD